MTDPKAIDGLLVQWGDRLFYPGNRTVKDRSDPKLRGRSIAQRAARLRERIAATVVRRAPQVMLKVTGGGRGMKAIAAHFRYISKNGRLDIEDDRGEVSQGRDAVRDLAEEWRFGGAYIGDTSPRREAFNIILSMPRGTNPLAVQQAARMFARQEFADHKYVMVLHDHQANPHVHLSVRAESKDGRRLNPRKGDLHRWREVFAARLRELGIEAEATRQPTRGVSRRYPEIWQVKAGERGRWTGSQIAASTESRTTRAQASSVEAWGQIAKVLSTSGQTLDQHLCSAVRQFADQVGRRAPVNGRDWTVDLHSDPDRAGG